jgi:hypothetical protein
VDITSGGATNGILKRRANLARMLGIHQRVFVQVQRLSKQLHVSDFA